ncbi:MAG: hypothetical protein JST09_05370 [Bacteroidetes bacterium]|jgi:uncharacterized membrane protein YfcA|nr:hypothetical protein [Sphingobacteriales bacterium]MBL7731307.1 hypothetical protein [Chitinophagaceae bacterium]MBS1574713.1 hypothetical protein [Bacteroidota bacterium]
MKEKSIVASATLITSLLSYAYAKETGKDAVPFVMVGGFIGSIIGEGIAELIKNNNKTNGNTNIQ